MRIENKFFSMNLDIDEAKLSFEGEVLIDKMSGKTAGEMKNLLFTPKVKEEQKLYDFYVGTADAAHKEVIQKSGLRYDIIMVMPGMIGEELKKTSGHKHEGMYPEIYEVLYGTAMFLLQKGEGKNIDYFAGVKAQAGEKILIPPGYSHATVNLGECPLVFSDLVAEQCRNDYKGIKDNRGMGYYITQKGEEIQFIKNENYDRVPKALCMKPIGPPEMGLDFRCSVYDLLCTQPLTYDYLLHPNEYKEAINYLANRIEERSC